MNKKNYIYNASGAANVTINTSFNLLKGERIKSITFNLSGCYCVEDVISFAFTCDPNIQNLGSLNMFFGKIETDIFSIADTDNEIFFNINIDVLNCSENENCLAFANLIFEIESIRKPCPCECSIEYIEPERPVYYIGIPNAINWIAPCCANDLMYLQFNRIEGGMESVTCDPELSPKCSDGQYMWTPSPLLWNIGDHVEILLQDCDNPDCFTWSIRGIIEGPA